VAAAALQALAAGSMLPLMAASLCAAGAGVCALSCLGRLRPLLHAW
jgi:hypothetical protein